MHTTLEISQFALFQTEFGGTEGPDLTRYLTVCVVLILGTGLIAYLFRRFLSGSMRGRAEARSLRIIDVLPLGGKKKLSIVRCYDRTLVLGVGEKEVSLVAELDRVVGETEVIPAAAKEPDFERLLTTARANLETKRRRRANENPLEQVVA